MKNSIRNIINRIKSKPLELGLAAGILIGSTGLYGFQKLYEYSNLPEVKAESERFNKKTGFAFELEGITRQGDSYFREALRTRNHSNTNLFMNNSNRAIESYEIAKEMCKTNEFATPWQSNNVNSTLKAYKEALEEIK